MFSGVIDLLKTVETSLTGHLEIEELGTFLELLGLNKIKI
jgi:hypothetical protein